MQILGSFDLSFDFSFEIEKIGTACIIITDKYGNPVVNAEVTSLCDNIENGQGTTDINGKIIIKAINNKYNQFTVKIEGFQTVTITIAPPFTADCTAYSIDYCIDRSELNRNSGGFFRFESVNYCRTFLNECTNFCYDEICQNEDEIYKIPALIADRFTFIVNPQDIGLSPFYVLTSGLKIGIYQGGKFIQECGIITQDARPDTYQLVCIVTIPNIIQGDYQFGFSNDAGNILATVDYTNTGGQDGTITITPTTGVQPYRFSIDGGKSFQTDGNYQDLQKGVYKIIVIDSDCNEFEQTIELIQNIDCSLYADSFVNDLANISVASTLNCYVNDFE